MWIGGFILDRVVFILNDGGSLTASNTRLEVDIKVVASEIHTYTYIHAYIHTYSK